MQTVEKRVKQSIINPYKCPKSLWNRMSSSDMIEYNRCMAIIEQLDDDDWLIPIMENKEKDKGLGVAHNFLISTLRCFNK